MAHFAEIGPDNVVIRTLVVSNDQEHRGNEFLSVDCGFGGTWIQTSYNTRKGVHIRGGAAMRKNYACPGYTFDPKRDAFIPPRPPGDGWSLDEETCTWIKE